MPDISIDARFDGHAVAVENNELDLISVSLGEVELTVNWNQAQQIYDGLRGFFDISYAAPQPDSAAPGGDVEALITDLRAAASIGRPITRAEVNEIVAALSAPKQVGDVRDSHRGGSSYEASMLRNLLARIHGDGGHYVEQHGLDKALDDADQLVAEWRATASPQAAPVPVEGEGRELLDLIDEYWDLAYAEGKEGRDCDTENGDAQKCRFAIQQHVRKLTTPTPPSQPAVELWKFVDLAFSSSKTSTSERFLECLGLPSDEAHKPLSWHINRALALIDGAKK